MNDELNSPSNSGVSVSLSADAKERHSGISGSQLPALHVGAPSPDSNTMPDLHEISATVPA